MAVPGSPVEPLTGRNLLIGEGATLVQSAADLIELPAGLDGAPEGKFLWPADPA